MIFSMMKKIKLTLLLALCALALTGCENPTANAQSQRIESHGMPECLEVVKFRGHSYILFNGYKRGGIIHDPDCPCHKTNTER